MLLLSLSLFCHISLGQNSGLSDYEAMMLYLRTLTYNQDPIEKGHQVYLESLENNEFLNIYSKPGFSWSLCNRKLKINF